MGAVSLSEDIFERLIEEVQQIRRDLTAPDQRLDKSEAHLRACELACEQLISRLHRASEIAADPSLARPQRIDLLQIENHNLRRDSERAGKDIVRLRSKLAEHRAAAEKTLNVQIARATTTDKENRSLREQLKAKNAAIAHFARTHHAAPKPKGRRATRRK